MLFSRFAKRAVTVATLGAAAAGFAVIPAHVGWFDEAEGPSN